jgi:hypothetical protein
MPQLTLADIKARITRLEQLARGLAREWERVRAANTIAPCPRAGCQ